MTLRNLLLTCLLGASLGLAGCGGGGGGGGSAPSAGGTAPSGGGSAPTTGILEVQVDFGDGTVQGRLPAEATCVVVHVLDRRNGAPQAALVEVDRTAARVESRSVRIEDLPPSPLVVVAEVLDREERGLGVFHQEFQVPAGGTAQVTVGSLTTLAAVEVSPAAAVLPVGGTVRLGATVRLADGSRVPGQALVDWSSSNGAVAAVSGGQVSGASVGTARILASAGGLTGSATLVVAPAGASLASLEVGPQSATLEPGEVRQYVAEGRFSDGSTLDLTEVASWASTAPEVATVSDASGTRGRVTAEGQGRGGVRAGFSNLGGEAALEVMPRVEPVTWRLLQSEAPEVLRGVAAGNGLQVLVDHAGFVRTAADGAAWTPPTRVAMSAFNGVAFGAGRFVAVDAAGSAWVSADGQTWDERSLLQRAGSPGSLEAVAFGAGVFVAVQRRPDGRGAVVLSADGDAWTAVTSSVGGESLRPLHCLAFANGAFVAGGEGGSLYSSPDGLSWWEGTVAGGQAGGLTFLAVAGGDGRFVAGEPGGQVVTSSDGLAWSAPARATGASLRCLAWGGGRFVLGAAPDLFDGGVDQGILKVSPDGTSWTTLTENPSLDLRAVAFVEGRFLALGSWARAQAGPLMLTSPDGLAWRPVLGAPLRGVAWGDAGFVAVGDGGAALSSPGGSTWTARPSGTLLDLRGLAFGAGRYVAVGSAWLQEITGGPDQGANDRSVATVRTSPDGAAWTETLPGGLTERQALAAVAFGNGLFVAAGGDGRPSPTDPPVLFTSPDGIAWTAGAPPPEAGPVGAFGSVAFARGRFFLAGPGATPGTRRWFTSTDGASWTALGVAPAGDFRSVAWAEGLYLAGDGQGCWQSSDGIAWAPATLSGFDPTVLLRSGGRVFAGIGRGATLGSSRNGIGWTLRFAEGETPPLWDLAFGDGTWVAVGDRGALLTSP